MPLTLNAVNRRQFLAGSLSAGFLAAFFSKDAFAAGNADHWVFLSDTHVPGQTDLIPKPYVELNYNSNRHFEISREEVLKLADKPKGVIVTGDFAYLQGKPEDYARLVKQVAPYLDGGVSFYVAFGNHDDLDNYYAAFTQYKKESSPVADEHLTVIETPNVNMILLDSLDTLNKEKRPGGGVFGEAQLTWLKKELSERNTKPALLFAHHNPEHLSDWEAYWDIIKEHKHVKAYIYGHTHVYTQKVKDDIHLINLPALGWEFQKGKQPLGWTDVLFSPDGLQLSLHCVNKNHEKNSDVRKFTWLR